ncbi:hypothetical protein QQ91_0006765 [Lyngbya confervoides BDU141951]|uniref:GAF domain-containing protein n=1 Tax=Lyngbya confervoides BDU141951 TaxID=1574623 RepID=A0ABD4T2F0_9CYAN|nr:hypothetical protein [Lyngbya confervoides]MCM1982525.1 hypothetical protein [Lyngbya confervoides BDU141951]
MTQSIPRGELSQDLESLQQILAQLQSAKDETALLQALSGYLQAHFGYPLVWLARFDPETQALTGDYQQFSSRQPVRETLTVLAGDLFDQTLLTRRPAIVPSLQDETRVGRWQKLAKRTGTQGAILQPIHHCKEPVGMLLVGSTHWGINPRKPERTHVSILAGTLGMVLHSIPINPMVPQPRQGQASLSAELPPLLTILTQLTAFDLQMAQVLSYLQRQHPEFSCGYYYLDEASQDWVSPTFLDPKDRRSNRGKAREHRLSARQNSSFFRYLASQSLLAISDVQASVDLRAPAPLTQHLEARSLLLQPILVQQALQGFLFLSHPQPRNWTELEKASLGIAANLLQLIWPPPSEEEISALPGTQEDRGLLSLPSPQSDPAAWESGIKRYFMEIERLFKARWVLLLRCDEETQSFEILLAQSSSRRSIPEFVGLGINKLIGDILGLNRLLLNGAQGFELAQNGLQAILGNPEDQRGSGAIARSLGTLILEIDQIPLLGLQQGAHSVDGG